MLEESGVYHSLHQNCHHQITFPKFNLKVYYLPPYERNIFQYFQANADYSQQAINNLFDWKNALLNTDVDAQMSILSNTFLNILHSHVPHDIKTSDHRDPPWMTNKT